MNSLRYSVIKAAFEALTYLRLPRLVRNLSSSRGVIFTLHRVLPEPVADFAPNSILQVTPDFLDAMIVKVRDLGFDTVSMDEAVRRLKSDKPERRFVVFTFDDAYRDNLIHALPILRTRKCPFTLYVPTAFVDGVGEVWWQALEDIIARRKGLSIEIDGETDYHSCKTTGEKAALFTQVYRYMRRIDEDARVKLMREIAKQTGFDLSGHCRSLIMDWSELQTFAEEPLCTIGAHTVHHYELAKLSSARARSEMLESIRTLDIQLGVRPKHFSYPIGGRASAGEREYSIARDLKIASAVTTLPGGLYRRHGDMPWALPRISLNGNFQNVRYASLFVTGALFSLIGRA